MKTRPDSTDPALGLLRELPENPPLSASARKRIWDNVERATPRGRSRAWLVAATACAALALIALMLRRPSVPSVPAHATLPDGVLADDGHGGRATLAGPGEATVDGDGTIRLGSGATRVASGERPMRVVARGVTTEVAPHSVVEIRVRDVEGVAVATWSGTAEVRAEIGAPVTVGAGQRWPEETRPSATRDEPVAPIPPAKEPARHSQHPPPLSPSPTPEATRLADAIRKLRHDHDPGAALRLLDAGSVAPDFADEARLVRVEAMQALGDTAALLRFLDRERLIGPRARELLLLRADLRAQGGRCSDAVIDYTALIAAGGDVEAPLSRRAACRFQLNEPERAKADLGDYLRRYPDGPHAAEARRALGREP
jgi:hypothetical protein